MELTLFEIKNVFLPEIILFVCIIANILFSLFFGKKIYKLAGRYAVLSVLLPLAAMSFGIAHTGYTIFSENYIHTNFTMLVKVIILIGTFFTILLSQNITQKLRHRAFEYYSILLTAAFASMCLVSSNDFIPMFVSLETLSIACCMLIAFWNKYQPKEAAIKYLINSAVATGIIFFGVSYLYGISGELNFTLLNLHYYSQDTSVLFIIASLFIIIGLTFKTGCMPFQRWVPDVYQGAPYPIAAFLSVIPPLAGFGILARIIGSLMYDTPLLQFIISLCAVLTIAYGFIGAIRQADIKRLLGYSSTAHCGFMLLSLSIFTNSGVSSFLYYALVYLFMSFGAWAAAITFVSCTGSDDIKNYTGLFYIRPYYTAAFLICLMALAGLPPTAGFLSKLYVFISLIRIDTSGLPIVAVAALLTIFGMYFYVNLIKIMFDKDLKTNCQMSSVEHTNTKIVLYFCTLMTILAFFFADKLIGLSMFTSIGI
ncbi:MAG: NADH-quinone oxidoreductase subunit N [Candidatus Gastranaerophilaceae bacterium]